MLSSTNSTSATFLFSSSQSNYVDMTETYQSKDVTNVSYLGAMKKKIPVVRGKKVQILSIFGHETTATHPSKMWWEVNAGALCTQREATLTPLHEQIS